MQVPVSRLLFGNTADSRWHTSLCVCRLSGYLNRDVLPSTLTGPRICIAHPDALWWSLVLDTVDGQNPAPPKPWAIIVCWYLQGNRIIPGNLERWCGTDFAAIQSITLIRAEGTKSSAPFFKGAGDGVFSFFLFFFKGNNKHIPFFGGAGAGFSVFFSPRKKIDRSMDPRRLRKIGASPWPSWSTW